MAQLIETLNQLACSVMVVQEDVILFANTACLAILGYPLPELQRMHLSQLVLHDQLKAVSFEDKAPHTASVSLRKADGSFLWLDLHFAPSLWDGQLASLVTVTIPDTKPLLQPETQAILFEDRLKALHSLTFELYKTQSIDELCRRAVELGRSELHFDRLSLWLVDEDTAFMRGTYGTDEAGNLRDEHLQRLPLRDFDLPTVAVDSSGHLREMSLFFDENVPLYDHNHEVIGRGWSALACIRDGDQVIGFLSTDNLIKREPMEVYQLEVLVLYAATLGQLYARKHMESIVLEGERAKLALQKEQEMSGLKSSLMVRISHEFRNPLAVILNSAEILELYGERLTPEKQAKHLNLIKYEVDILTTLLDDIMMSARGMFGRLEYAPQPFDLERLCRNVAEELYARHPLRTHIELAIQGELEQFVGDQRLIYLMIENLISNALKFSPPDSPIRLEVVASETEVLLQVSDQGVGILPEEQERIFEPFFRGSNIDETPGLGVGLSIVRDAAQLHGGTVTLESEPGKGTRFVVCLPLIS